MPTYLVERYVPRAGRAQLAEIVRTARAAAGQAGDSPGAIRYLAVTLVPGDELCYCLFEAPTIEAVQQAHDLARIPASGSSRPFTPQLAHPAAEPARHQAPGIPQTLTVGVMPGRPSSRAATPGGPIQWPGPLLFRRSACTTASPSQPRRAKMTAVRDRDVEAWRGSVRPKYSPEQTAYGLMFWFMRKRLPGS